MGGGALSVFVLATAVAAHAFAGGAVEVLDHQLPERLSVGDRLSARVTVRNNTDYTWRNDEGFAVAYHWLAEDGRVVVWDGPRSAIADPVPPGTEVTLDVQLEAPPRPGLFVLVLDVVQEGHRWLAGPDLSGQEPTVIVEAGPAFSIIGARVPRFPGPGVVAVAPVELQNDGPVTWPAGTPVALSYHWIRPDGAIERWDGLRTPLPHAVAPGQRVLLEAEVETPERGGRYLLSWDVVEEGVRWLSEVDPSPSPPYVVVVLPALSFVVVPIVLVVVLLTLVELTGRIRNRTLAIVACADVMWLVGSLLFKQMSVLAEARLLVSQRAFTSAAVGAVAVGLVLLLLPRRTRPWISWLAVVAATALIQVDLVYQRFFSDLPSLAVVGAAGQTGELVASVTSLLAGRDVLLWIDVVLGLVLVLRLPRRSPSATGRAWTALAVAVAVVAGIGVVDTGLSAEPELLDQVFRNVFVAREIGVLNFHAWDLFREARRCWSRARYSEAQLADIAQWFRDHEPDRRGQGATFAVARGANLLMIQVESLQGFVVGMEVGGQEVTPTLNRWRKESLSFSWVTDQTAQGRSSDCELLTQASLLPPVRGAAVFRYAGNRFVALAGILREHGYHTLSAVPFDGGFWNRRVTHPAWGYSRQLFADDFAPGETIGWGLNDRELMLQMVDHLDGLERPFCAWMITLSLHHPFAGFPQEHKQLDVGQWEGTPFGNFLHTMHFFDQALADLEARMAATGLLDDTVVVLWGDHDAGFEWSAEIAAAMGFPHDSAGWYQSQRVPLVIRLPARLGLAGERTVPAGQVDVAPTVLALLGIDPAPFPLMGRNLLGEVEDRPVVGEYGCWTNGATLFLESGATVDHGRCLDRWSLEPLSIELCRRPSEDARRQIGIATAVLEHNLQRKLLEQRVGGRS